LSFLQGRFKKYNAVES